jgi:putative nucleotidyltransferase with HDIG domain
MTNYCQAPAAQTYHHRGSLLEHSLCTAGICLKMAEPYPEIDSDLILIGALLHDLGKSQEIPTIIDCFCLGWWFPFITKMDISFNISIRIGIIVGIQLNVLFIKKVTHRIFSLNQFLLAATYLFYTVGIFGFFMGVPVFNIALGPVAGYYIGRRSSISKSTYAEFSRKLKNTQAFVDAVLLCVCAVSAFIALRDQYTAANLEGRLNLNFRVNQSMIRGQIIAGGFMLLVFQYMLVSFAFHWTYGKNRKSLVNC